MKARELMPGDIVSLFGNACIIDGLSISEGTLRIEGDTVHYYADRQEIEPIQLTADILEMNGWKKNGSYNEYILHCDKDFYEFIIYNMHDKHVVIRITHKRSKQKIYVSVHFVHELQHALRLCGLGEIADNFKIK